MPMSVPSWPYCYLIIHFLISNSSWVYGFRGLNVHRRRSYIIGIYAQWAMLWKQGIINCHSLTSLHLPWILATIFPWTLVPGFWLLLWIVVILSKLAYIAVPVCQCFHYTPDSAKHYFSSGWLTVMSVVTAGTQVKSSSLVYLNRVGLILANFASSSYM